MLPGIQFSDRLRLPEGFVMMGCALLTPLVEWLLVKCWRLAVFTTHCKVVWSDRSSAVLSPGGDAACQDTLSGTLIKLKGGDRVQTLLCFFFFCYFFQ